MNSPIRVALLGPPAVRVGNEVVPIAGTKLQSVLALLALAAPHPVPDGRLVEELWGDAQPAIGTISLPTRTSVGPSSATRTGLFIAVPLPSGFRSS